MTGEPMEPDYKSRAVRIMQTAAAKVSILETKAKEATTLKEANDILKDIQFNTFIIGKLLQVLDGTIGQAERKEQTA